MNSYIFTSKRLGFRNWKDTDVDILSEINNDDDVMEFFPFKPSKQDTKKFIENMQRMQSEQKFCYFAVDVLETKECIGFIGLCLQTYLKAPKSFVDIGWRLKKSSWNQGYATEGAKACLAYGFNTIGLREIYAVAPSINKKSAIIMKKIGMHYVKTFNHPKLSGYEKLESCVLYYISKSELQ
ncbi:GNAT family N-acetyltransferase [Aquimarina sp. U1-2]|uniref:GNAT family N-acetyltransferase n=1 Tax=Aquimarina sp. U1-2 TaxID=2823141 RepID=UPI001AECC73A|nr:GNAT family N-acetyltransferase [Aquimarina sp. U1-2]MBP2833593.1 GNAT family N-acetyltransferase [Aquimarina sp. U1-2]